MSCHMSSHGNLGLTKLKTKIKSMWRADINIGAMEFCQDILLYFHSPDGIRINFYYLDEIMLAMNGLFSLLRRNFVSILGKTVQVYFVFTLPTHLIHTQTTYFQVYKSIFNNSCNKIEKIK